MIRFGEFSADLETGELHQNGVKVKLQGQPFEILALLLQRPGRIVTREELHKKLWPGDTFVDFEHGLNAAVNKLRVALGDSAENPVWIDTLPRRGYRFIAPVENSLPPEALGPPSVGAQLAPRTWTLRLALFFGLCVLLAGARLFLYRRQHAPASRERSPVSHLMTACKLVLRGLRTVVSLPTVPTAGENSTSGCNRSAAAIP